MDKKEYIHSHERLDDLQYNDLYLIQDPQRYCFNSDSVALANFAKIKKGERMVDLCAGSGVVGMLTMAKGSGDHCVLVEVQSWMADMANRSLLYNDIDNISVVCDKLQDVHQKIGREQYDVVTCNPPYKSVDGSLTSQEEHLAICRHEVLVTLEEVVKEASCLLKYGGRLYLVHKSNRLADMMYLCKLYKLEPKRLQILPSNKGMSVVLLEAVKGGKVGLIIEE